jgi:hypothetical protein
LATCIKDQDQTSNIPRGYVHFRERR